MATIIETWKTRSHLAKIVLLLVILYCVSSINVLLLALGITNWIPGLHLNPDVLIAFAIISFVFSIFVSAYHLSTFLRRRKRMGDRIVDAQAQRTGA